VALVYDIEDTEGDCLLPHDVAQAFRATGDITDSRISRFIELLAKQGIETVQVKYGDGLAGNISRPEYTMEVIRQTKKTRMQRTPRKSHITASASIKPTTRMCASPR